MTQFKSSFQYIKTLPSAFWTVILASLMNQVGNMAFVFIILYLTSYLGFDLTHATAVFVVFSASMLIFGLLGGSIVDKVGAARMMVATLFVNGFVLISIPHLQHFGSILIACVLWGCFFGLYRPASQTFISYLSTAGLHKITFSVYRLAINLGMSIGPAIGGYLAAHYFPIIFYANGCANILASLILLIGLYRTSWFRYRGTYEKKFSIGFRYLFSDKALGLFIVGLIPVCMVFFQHESTLAVFLNGHLKLPLSFYGSLFTINTLMIVFLELPLNVLTLEWSYRTNFVLGSLLITAGFAGMVFVTHAWHVVLLTAVWTLGEMILFPASSSYIADISPLNRRGSYMSLYSMCSNLGMMLGPWCGAMMIELTNMRDLWIACGIWGLVSVLLLSRVKQPIITHETNPS